MAHIEVLGHEALRARIQMSEKGRVVIPAAIREALGIGPGDLLEARVEEGELRISTRQERLRRAQEWVRQYVPAGVSPSDELSAERREAAQHD